MCLAGAVIASWSLTQKVADSRPFTVMTNNSVLIVLSVPAEIVTFD